jgi:hypothetical protein
MDPTRFGEWTYPMILCAISRGQSGKADADEDRARRVLKDFRSGAIGW